MPPLDSHTRRQFLTSSGALLGLGGARAIGDEVAPPNIIDRLRRDMDAAALEMRFRGGTAAECRTWQAAFGARLRALLGPHSPPRAWKTVTQRSVELDGYRREELLLVAEGVPSLPVYLLLPRPKLRGRRPGALALHGHGAHGHHPVAGRDDLPGVAAAIKSANYDYGRQLARRGYAVAVPCLTPFGVRGVARPGAKVDACGDTFIRLQLLGRLLIGENLRDALWALELLARHEEVDANRLGCVGLSYGGRMTMLTAAVEPRVKVAVISGALNVMQERAAGPYGCGAQIIPGLLRIGDTPEIASLIAPRHCLWEVGARDALLPVKWADDALGRIRRAYQASGVPERLLVDRFPGGHAWHGTMAYPLLDKVFGHEVERAR